MRISIKNMVFFKLILKPLILLYNWEESEYKFLKFLNMWNKSKEPQSKLGNDVAVVIQPWLGSSVPWVSVVLAHLLLYKERNVVIIWNDLEFGLNKKFNWLQNKSIKNAFKCSSKNFCIIKLSDYLLTSIEKCNINTEEIDEIVNLNAIWHFKGQTLQKGRKFYKRTINRQLKKAYIAIQSLLEKHTFEYLVLPGGIYGSSSLFFKLFNRKGIRVATFDSGLGAFLLSSNGIASQMNDISDAFKVIENDNNSEFIIAEAKNEISRRRAGKNIFNYLLNCNDNLSIENPYILIMLNSSWDSAALGLHMVFDGNFEWIVESVKWVLDNSKDVVVIRQHPAEKTIDGKSNDDYMQLLHNNFGNNKRVIFISCNDSINSYSLLEKAEAVLVYTSTIGIEAAASRKIVITESKSYYADLGFVFKAKNKNEYFGFLDKAIRGELQVSEKQEENALKCYYLSQCCNWIMTDFNPVDFEKWVHKDFESLNATQEVKDILTSIDENIPISLIVHKRRLESVMNNIKD